MKPQPLIVPPHHRKRIEPGSDLLWSRRKASLFDPSREVIAIGPTGQAVSRDALRRALAEHIPDQTTPGRRREGPQVTYHVAEAGTGFCLVSQAGDPFFRLFLERELDELLAAMQACTLFAS